jgi:hypothetical protein
MFAVGLLLTERLVSNRADTVNRATKAQLRGMISVDPDIWDRLVTCGYVEPSAGFEREKYRRLSSHLEA